MKKSLVNIIIGCGTMFMVLRIGGRIVFWEYLVIMLLGVVLYFNNKR